MRAQPPLPARICHDLTPTCLSALHAALQVSMGAVGPASIASGGCTVATASPLAGLLHAPAALRGSSAPCRLSSTRHGPVYHTCSGRQAAGVAPKRRGTTLVYSTAAAWLSRTNEHPHCLPLLPPAVPAVAKPQNLQLLVLCAQTLTTGASLSGAFAVRSLAPFGNCGVSSRLPLCP